MNLAELEGYIKSNGIEKLKSMINEKFESHLFFYNKNFEHL